jgi:hypothetical protein
VARNQSRLLFVNSNKIQRNFGEISAAPLGVKMPRGLNLRKSKEESLMSQTASMRPRARQHSIGSASEPPKP